MTYKLLMVCTGNICRSVMAEIVLNQKLQERAIPAQVDSAGISDEEHGGPIDPRAARTLRRAGYDVPSHRAHQVQPHELAEYDLVLAMTSSHYQALERLAQRAGIENTSDRQPGEDDSIDLRMFRSFEPGSDTARRRHLDVPDPWYGDQSDFERTLETIESVAEAIIAHVEAQTQQ